MNLSRTSRPRSSWTNLVTPHALRHYYASKLIEKKKDAKFIQNRLGHSSIEITFNVYGHLMKDREEANKRTAEELATELIPA